MKCPKCQAENKDYVKNCKKCGYDFTIVPLWQPTWKWHLKTLSIVYSVLIILFFFLNIVLKPYLRQIPKDITPWLKEIPKKESVG
ncbi:MAG: zinc ribbon domain-containing protein [Elusimicrobia bacterium]|nr:zinc ribbon domain-containing protein [Elusimicrobiota bacterium]